MAGFRLDAFSGIRPRASDVRLEAHEALEAIDVDLRRGLLRPRPKQKVWVQDVDPQLPFIDEGDVVLLLNFDEADGSTTFIDDSGYDNVVTANGTAQQDTGEFKYGSASADLTATGRYLSVPMSAGAPLDVFQGDFTVECWVRFSTVTGQHVVFDLGDFVGTNGIRLYCNNAGLICQASFYHSWHDLSHTDTLVADTWYHVAVCRQGNAGFISLNGVVKNDTSPNWTTSPTTATSLRLGASSNGAYLLGHLDGFRVTRGLARYTSDFSVPTAPPSAGGPPETLYRFHRRSDDTDFWMYWPRDVNIVPGPAESAQQRHYYTGDGVPKMFTADSIDDTTPPYTEGADSKYPYTWYYLGVPAPTAAPVLDVDEIPEPSEGSVGLITSVITPNLLLNINLNLDHSGGGLTIASCGEDGRNAGLSTTNISAQGGQQNLLCLNTGTRVRVTEIVDADNVKVVAAGRSGPIEVMGMVPDSSAWRWDNALGDVHKHTWLTRLNSTAKRKSYFLLPDEVTLEITGHILRVGDIVRITGSAAPMTWASTPGMVTDPVPTVNGQNYGFRTATPDAPGNVEFIGSTSFMIERDGSSIDPVVPATADFEIEARAYVYTYVSALGEESAPSPPSDIVTIRVGDEVPITTFAAPPTARRNIDRIWVYRTNTGSEDTAFQFVGELAVADIADGFTDDVPNEELGEVLETEGWDVPDEDMIGLVAMPNGILAGFFNNVLCFSEPGFPHAWPSDYRVALDFDIVGLEVFGNALCVTTKGKPYITVGVHPLQMSARHVDVIQSCLDKRSIVKTKDSVVYGSPEGLISAGAGFTNVTEKYYTKEQWQRIVGPDNATERSLRAWYFDSQYILLATYTFDDVTTTTKQVFDFRDGEMRVTAFSEPIVAAFADPETAELYYLVNEEDEPSGTPTADNRMLLRWDHEHPDADVATGFSEGDYITGEFRLPHPMSFSCARVQCRRVLTASGTMNAHAQVTITVNGRRYDAWNAATTPAEDEITLINDQAVIDGQPGAGGWAGEQRSLPFRIPTNVLVDAVSFEIHVEGPVEVETVQLGECMEDLESS